MAKNELYHHGIKGQRWGVRRYQYEDGSYKPGAEGRYAQDGNGNNGSGSSKSRNSSQTSRSSDEYKKEVEYNSRKNRYPQESSKINLDGSGKNENPNSTVMGTTSQNYFYARYVSGYAVKDETTGKSYYIDHKPDNLDSMTQKQFEDWLNREVGLKIAVENINNPTIVETDDRGVITNTQTSEEYRKELEENSKKNDYKVSTQKAKSFISQASTKPVKKVVAAETVSKGKSAISKVASKAINAITGAANKAKSFISNLFKKK